MLVPEAPFHEGRDEGVLRSSAEDALSGTESQRMGSPVAGDRKCPVHLAAPVPHEEEQMLLEIVEKLHGQPRVELQGAADLRGGERTPVVARQFANYEVADGVVLRGHEGEQFWTGHFVNCTPIMYYTNS